MKILHTSDWHLGISLFDVPQIEEQRAFADFLVETAESRGVDAVLISGDIFDRAVAPLWAVELFNGIVTRLCSGLGVEVVAIAGNHDGASRLGSYAELLKKSGLHIFGKLELPVAPVRLTSGEIKADIYPLPFFSPDELAFLTGSEVPDLRRAYELVLSGIREGLDGSCVNILMAHCYFSGAELCESDRSARVGGIGNIGKIAIEGFDYAALGHLHRAQSLPPCAHYSGSPLKYSFGETEKSLTLLTFTDGGGLTIERIHIKPKRDLVTLTGSFDELLDLAKSDTYADDYIKAELTDTEAGAETAAIFRQYWQNLLTIRGKTHESEPEQLSVDVRALGSEELFCMFMEDVARQKPTPGQLDCFRRALVNAVLEEEENDAG